MSDLIVVSFKSEETADQALNKLQALQREYVVELEDAVVAVRDTNGKVHLKQAVNLAGIGAASGAAWGGLFGMLVGVLFLNPGAAGTTPRFGLPLTAALLTLDSGKATAEVITL